MIRCPHQVRKEKSNGFAKIMELFTFMRDVVTNKQTWSSDEQKMMTIVKTRSEGIITAFTPEIDTRDRDERAGKIRCLVQTILARALGF